MGELTDAPYVVQAPPLAEHTGSGGASGRPPSTTPPQSGSPTSGGQSWYVSPRGSRGGRGTLDSPLRTISQAVALAKPGDVVRVLPGTYSEQLFLESHGPNAAAITLRGEGTPLPTLVPDKSRGRSAAILVRGRWNIENLTVDLAGAQMSAIVFERGSNHSRVSGSELRSGTAGAGVLVTETGNITIQNNHIHHFIKPGDDSHGVLVVGPSRNVTVRDNDIHHNSGDSVQCHANRGRAAEDLLIEGNTMHDEGENAVDIKLCNRVTIRNNEMSGFPNTAVRRSGTSAGEAVILHDSARNITVQDNLMSRAGRGISVVAGSGRPPENVKIEGNTIQEIRNMPVGNGQGIRIESGVNVQVLDNLVENTASYGMMLAADNAVVHGLVVKKNTLRGGGQQALLLRLGHDFARPGIILGQNYYARGGVLKGDGLRELLGGVFAPFRGKFIGDELILSDPGKLDAWRQVLKVDQGSGIVD
jgi:pectate lyase